MSTLITQQRKTEGRKREDTQADRKKGNKSTSRHLNVPHRQEHGQTDGQMRKSEPTHSYSLPHPHPWPQVCSDLRAASHPLHLGEDRKVDCMSTDRMMHVNIFKELGQLRP